MVRSRRQKMEVEALILEPSYISQPLLAATGIESLPGKLNLALLLNVRSSTRRHDHL